MKYYLLDVSLSMWKILLRSKFMLTTFLIMALFTSACTVHVLPIESSGSETTGVEIEANSAVNYPEFSVALMGPFGESAQQMLYYPVESIEASEKLTSDAISALSEKFGDSRIKLEYALVQKEPVTFNLYYTSQMAPLEQVAGWREFVATETRTQGNESSPDRAESARWWSFYEIVDNPITVSSDSTTPSTLEDWMGLLRSQHNVEAEKIARLLFVVENTDGTAQHVLYQSGIRSDGGSAPDDEDTCRANPERSLYCAFVEWLNG